MLLAMCKSCQYCLENFYWSCCEERFCFDKKIASFRFEDDSNWPNGYTNMGASLGSIISVQPANNNHLPQHALSGGVEQGSRELNEVPVNADKIYEVFSRSMIFRDEPELNKSLSSNEALDEIETKSEPDLSDKPNRTKVYFEDEINSPITDFEIMFKDELLGMEKIGMCMIEEEEENERDDEGGIVMNVEVRRPGHDWLKPSSITIKEEAKITTPNPIFEYDSSKSVTNLPSTLAIPRVESVKSILRVSKDLPRSQSTKSLTRTDSSNAMKLPAKPMMNRVESLRNMETQQINRVLARVPHRSASFLNLPEHLIPEHKPIRKSDSAFAIRTNIDSLEFSQVSHLPDTPIIKSANLPRFFAESPALGEYKGDTSLQSIKQKTGLIYTENDYSMPRYGKLSPTLEPVPVHESKSMPDLRYPSSGGRVSKRLVKLRSKLKPLVIKKGTDDKL